MKSTDMWSPMHASYVDANIDFDDEEEEERSDTRDLAAVYPTGQFPASSMPGAARYLSESTDVNHV